MIFQILEVVLPIFIIISVGFVYSRAVKPDLSGINRMIVDIALPVLIFTSLSDKDFDPLSAATFAMASVLLIIASGVLVFPFARFSGANWRSLLPCVMFGNVGPVGIPLIVLAFGPEGLPIAVVLLVLSNILHFTLGAGVMSGRTHWRIVFTNPLVWATVAGIAVSQLGLTFPKWVDTPLTMIGNILVPTMLLSLGARLSTSEISDLGVGVRGTVFTTLARLFACYIILLVIPLEGIERGALILFACLPSAVFNYMLADKYNAEPNKVASMVVAGHFGSLIVLPLGLWLALM